MSQSAKNVVAKFVTMMTTYTHCTNILYPPTSPMWHLKSNPIVKVACRDLCHVIGRTSLTLTLPPLLTGSRGEYLRVVEIIMMVE